MISAELGRPPYGFLPDFFSEDKWNFITVSSAVLNILVITQWFQFAGLALHSDLKVPENSSQKALFEASGGVLAFTSATFQQSPATTNLPNNAQLFNSFAEAAKEFRNFQVFAALNIFFLCFRLMKCVDDTSPTYFISRKHWVIES